MKLTFVITIKDVKNILNYFDEFKRINELNFWRFQTMHKHTELKMKTFIVNFLNYYSIQYNHYIKVSTPDQSQTQPPNCI